MSGVAPLLVLAALAHWLRPVEPEQPASLCTCVSIPLQCDACKACPHLTPVWLRWFTWQQCDACSNCPHRVWVQPRWKPEERVSKIDALFACNPRLV